MNASSLRRRLPPAILLLALAAGRLTAQDPPRNPHGALTTPCGACHTAEGWAVTRVPRGFEHAARRFPLGGAHAATSCRSCHRALDFAGAPTACASCHRDVHNAELGADCGRCHTDRGFVDRALMTRQHQATRFTLTGSHAAVDCEQCHAYRAQGHMQFVNTPTDCDACHAQRFLATRSPDHQAGGFPRTCTQCHTTTLWTPARFNHDASRFALTGAHRAVPCDACHAGNRFAGAPSECSACHAADFQATTDPNHVAAGFPQACAACHGTVTWDGARFDHAASRFPLTGAHVPAPCAACHVGNVFSGTPTTCLACHGTEYTASRDPAHQAAGLPTDCAACHTTVGWSGARYTAHDAAYFPIYSGAHAGRWAGSCATCHTSPASYATFTCLTCHLKPAMDSKHAERAGYSYDSQACYRCHPRGTH